MLKGITWGDYLSAVVIAVFVYYLIIGYRYYGKSLLKQYKNRKNQDVSEISGLVEEGTFDQLEDLVEDIRDNILVMAGEEANKSELLTQLQQKLASYGGLHQPAYRVALNNFIIQHAKNICGVRFSEKELEEAWRALPR